MLTQPGIPNPYTLSTSCFGGRLKTIEDQAFAAVAMGFRRLELSILEAPVKLNGFEDSHRETGVTVSAVMLGCLDPRSSHMSGTMLGSLVEDHREVAINSLRRHVKLAQRLSSPTVIVRGCETEDRTLREESDKLTARFVRGDRSDEFKKAVSDLVARVHKKSQRQIEHLCRSIFTLQNELPQTRIAIEPGSSFTDLLNFQAVEWVIEDLGKYGLGYWHDTGRIHLREKAGLPTQGEWLDRYSRYMVGMHLQDAAESTAEMPPGSGEVDFKLVHDYVGSNIERVVEINPRHGRAEILAAVQFLSDRGF